MTLSWTRGVVAVILAAACATPGTVVPPTGAVKPDDLMIVDCLLPGQIRQLGGQMTYVSRPRAMKTAARDCAIRGGEYVAFDRADHATALRVWLPQAEQGDPKAQTYVGEIFEKGLGVAPDHAAAAQWYRRAAERGYTTAALNLGSLYERGLGVPKDPVQALSWYRRASGLGELKFDVSVEGSTAEVQALRAENERLRRERDAATTALDRAKRELDEARRGLDGRRSEIDAERGTIAGLRRQLDEARRREGAGAVRVRDLERSIAEHEARLASRQRETEELRARVTRLEAESRDRQARLERLRQQLTTSGKGPVISLLEPELRLARDTAGAARAEIDGDRGVVVGRVVTETEVVSLTVNGRSAPLKNNVFRSEVAVGRADQPVRIVAVDREGQRSEVQFLYVRRTSASATASRTGAGGAPRVGLPRVGSVQFGTYHALVIGNNDYKQLPRLKTAVNDATTVARVLEKDYGFRVRLLTNASRYEILAALNTLREQLTEKDNLLIYYAGHGELDERNQRGHWLPVDAEPNSTANWISNVAISDLLNAMSVQQLIVIADSCYAGTLTRSSVGRLEVGLSETERLRLMELLARKRSRLVMTSGGVEPVLDSAGGAHSVFAQVFLELLASNVGVLPGQELFSLLRLRVADVADRVGNMSQVPQYAPIKFAGHESGEFFFVRAAN
jgi:uncharacterized caspase-like protein